MLDETNEPFEKLVARNHELEARYTHLQRMVEELNEVVIEQGRKIDSLQSKLSAVSRQLGSLSDRDHEPRSLEEEKPPHY